MAYRDDDQFRPKLGPPRARGQAKTPGFIQRVVTATHKAGKLPGKGRAGARPGSRLGRGHVASRIAGGALSSRSRRVIIKSRLVILKKASPRSTAAHLRYIARDGVTREGEPGKLYNQTMDEVSPREFEELGVRDRHQFRFIVSPEDATDIGDLKAF